MQRKGLFEWKILAAVFAVLIVLSTAVVSNTGMKDFFMNMTGNLGGLMGESPFGSLFSTPQKEVNRVEIKLITGNITLNMETAVNVSVGSSNLENFRGAIILDFNEKSSRFRPLGSDMHIDMELQETVIRNVRIQKLSFDAIDFVITSEKTNISGSGERLEIHDFSGDIIITDHVLLSGNVTKAKNGKWSIG